ncbi:mariner transposase [Trichonephila clavipes]|nr:mariner transposase [Trichonephila clavipes]
MPCCLVFVWQPSIVSIFSEFVKMEKICQHYVIQYFLFERSLTNVKTELHSTLGESAPLFTTVKYWIAEFKRGCMSCQDEHCSGQSNEATTPEMVKKTHKAVLDDY